MVIGSFFTIYRKNKNLVSRSTSKLKEWGFIQSMSRKGNCYDNAQCKSCFSLLIKGTRSKVYLSMKEAESNL